MTAGLALGLDRASASRFSFLLAIPTVFASSVLITAELAQTSAPVDWASLALLPRRGRSFGPVTPPLLALALLWAPLDAATSSVTWGLGLVSALAATVISVAALSGTALAADVKLRFSVGANESEIRQVLEEGILDRADHIWRQLDHDGTVCDVDLQHSVNGRRIWGQE